ncbi:MAG TPA: hypothetical protein VK484_11000, partial [Ferruginibacter sp.]|nr:hypothetical protein [Ferruginibacter sp.]
MRKALLFIFIFFIFIGTIHAQAVKTDTVEVQKPDTVKAGIYITSIHDIDFKQKEYSINFWLWLKYKNRVFDFLQYLEIPNAKTVTKSFSTIDSSGGEIYIIMK